MLRSGAGKGGGGSRGEIKKKKENKILKKKMWSLDRRPWNPSIHRKWHSTFHLEMGALRPPVVTFAERAGSQWGLRLFPGLSPFWSFSTEVSLLSTMVASLGCRLQSGGALPESCDEVMVFFTLFFLFSNVLVIVYRHGYLH
jgi:hypothetical protein